MDEMCTNFPQKGNVEQVPMKSKLNMSQYDKPSAPHFEIRSLFYLLDRKMYIYMLQTLASVLKVSTLILSVSSF